MSDKVTDSSVSVDAIEKTLPSSLEKDMNKSTHAEKRKSDDCESSNESKKTKIDSKLITKKTRGFRDDHYNETSYYIENGLRKVYPYYFTFTTYTKGRWVGEKILDVFAREFRAHSAEEYERCINVGTLTVNHKKVTKDYILKHNDLLSKVVHRHEVPVSSQPITILHMDEDVVVVNKPASIPVHPCGRYRHNTVVFILAKENGLKGLKTVHRLDRLTSGLLLSARSPDKARQMINQIKNKLVSKEYVCRVEGEFPDEEIECNEPIEVVSYKIGVCRVSPKGKDCATTFRKLSYNGKTSVVLCKPQTGRMHQIRVHLQYLGFPIVNDPLYNHEIFGPLKGKGGDIGEKSYEELIKDLIQLHNAENWLGIEEDTDLLISTKIPNLELEKSKNTATVSTKPLPSKNPCIEVSSVSSNLSDNAVMGDCEEVKGTGAMHIQDKSSESSFNPDKVTFDEHCYECKVQFKDPKLQDLVMYLHALKYKGPEWEYETELPDWAHAEWIQPPSR